MATFIIDCPNCKAKVAAEESGRAERAGYDDDASEPWAEKISVGKCPRCSSLLVGHSQQVAFEDFNSEYDAWSDIVRVFPKPSKTFSSYRIPKTVTESLGEAERSIQVNANIAACVMLGRALEALCRDALLTEDDIKAGKKVMLANGIKQLYEKNLIDDRLLEWSKQLHAFRNVAAHPEDISISREDTEDLQAFVYAIIEYIYDLTDRYEDFKVRLERRKKPAKKST